MAVLLKNLMARTPNTQDLAALSDLVRLCESGENSVTDSRLTKLLSGEQQPDFHLANDAWVIVTTRGHIVGFACVWHKEHTSITTFICVHPDYRNRGIGTLLLRMAEVRARQHVRLARPEKRVVLQGLIDNANTGAHRLFEHEGYRTEHSLLRISFTLPDEGEQRTMSAARRGFELDVMLEEQKGLPNVTPLCDQDALCSVHLYRMYEKELRPASRCSTDAEADLHIVNV